MNRLEHLEEFDRILKNYSLPEEVTSLLKGMKLVLLVGPSAVGRNTIIDKLLSTGDYVFIISDTTRKPRVNDGVEEKNGEIYWFRNEEDFLRDLKNGEFLEAEIIHSQQVSGISIRELRKASEAGAIAITDVDIEGFTNIMTRKPDTVGIYVLPPNFAEWLKRIQGRVELPHEEVINRLKTGLKIFEKASKSENSHFVVNDNLEKTIHQINILANGGESDIADAKQLISNLLIDTKRYLEQDDA